MRKFVIGSPETLLGVAVVLFGFGVAVAALKALSTPQGGLLMALAVLRGGFVTVR